MNYLAICAIVRYERNYIEEWLKFHKSLGVEHFYIYDHFSEPGTMDIVKSFGDKLTTVIPWSRNMPGSPQRNAYEQCFKTYRDNYRWLGFFDIDEFVVPRQTTDLPGILKEYEEYAGVGFHWRLFGNNGHQHYSPEPVVERFTTCERGVNEHIKGFIDPRRTQSVFTAHRFVHPVGGCVDENKVLIAEYDSKPPNGTTNIVQINHYVTKSYDECAFRRSKPRVDTNNFAEREMKSFWAKHNKNDVEDFRARDIWRGIKG